MGLDLLHSQPFKFRLETKPGIEAVSSPNEGPGKGKIGEGVGMDRRRADAAGPTSGNGREAARAFGDMSRLPEMR